MVTQTAREARTFFFGAPKTHFDPGKTLNNIVSICTKEEGEKCQQRFSGLSCLPVLVTHLKRNTGSGNAWSSCAHQY